MTGALAARDDQELSTGRGIGRDVAVVGAGAVGAGAAYELARRGADVTLYDRDADPGFGASLCDRLRGRLPGLRPEVSRAWAGLCTATPDRQPLLGRLRVGLYVATGFQGQGFMRAPATGRLIAEQMLGGPGIEAFDPTRFSGDEEFGIREGMSVADEG